MKAAPGMFELGIEIERAGRLVSRGTLSAPLPFSLLRWWQKVIAWFLPIAVTHSVAIRNAIADVVVDALDAGSTNPQGRIKIQTAGHVTDLAIIPMANPSFGAATGGSASALSLPWQEDAAPAGGTAAVFDAIDRDANIVLQGIVSTGSGDLVVGNLVISVNDIVRVTSAQYTAPL